MSVNGRVCRAASEQTQASNEILIFVCHQKEEKQCYDVINSIVLIPVAGQ